MAEEDYAVVYHRFFENIVQSAQAHDPLPLRVASYNLTEEELLGQVVDCSVQYLYLLNCPSSLLTTLTKNVVDEVYNEYKKQPPQSSYEPLKIMKTVTKTVVEICRRNLDNEALSRLPPPPSEPLVSALGIKHTRRTMEDRMVHLPQLHTIYNIATETGYYGIFDGHNGSDAASFAVSHLHQFLVESPHFDTDIVAAFREAYKKTDAHFISKGSHGGSTSVAVLHQPTMKRLVVSWLGDSQAMLIKAGKPVMLVEPHRPQRDDETKRIMEHGGFVVELYGVWRVNGEIAVSRSFGDTNYKPFVSSEPDVRIVELDGSEEVLVLGCDGLWDSTTPAQVCETVQFQIHHEPDRIDLLSRRLVDLAKENGSLDNISVIAVLLKNPSEVTVPGTSMETPELETFRAPAPTNRPSNTNQDDDFGPETDVDAIDESNPFGDDCWTRPDPVQTFPDFSGMKPTPGMRLNSDFSSTGYDNPYSSNTTLQDIAEEKFVEDLKPEKEKLNGFENMLINGSGKTVDCFDDFVSNGVHKFDGNGFDGFETKINDEKLSGNGLDAFTVEDTTNGFVEQGKSDNIDIKMHETDLFGHIDDAFKATSDLPDLVQEREIVHSTGASPFADDFKPKEVNIDEFVEKVNNPFESQKEELFSTLEEKEIEDDTNPFDRSTPEPDENACEKTDTITEKVAAAVEKVAELPMSFELEEGQLQLETLKSMMLAEESNQLEEHLADLDVHSPVLEGNLLDSSDVSPQGLSSGDAVVPKAPEPLESDVGADIVEAVGEGDESEEEWNYYKVEPNQQDQGSMNSPLNPNAAEFVPVSPPTGLVGDQQTPIKAVPENLLDDVVVSSPNWANMDHVEVPALEEFLVGARDCPADLALDPNVPPFEMPAKPKEDDEPLAVPLPEDPLEAAVEAATDAFAQVTNLIPTPIDIEPIVETQHLAAVPDISFESIPKVEEVPPVIEPFSPEPAPLSPEPARIMNETFDTPATVKYSTEPPTPPVRSPEPTKEDALLDTITNGAEQILEVTIASRLTEQLVSELETPVPTEELRGLDLARDMTSSFIDPSTMGNEDFGAETPRSTVAESGSTPPSTPLTADLQQPSAPPAEIEEVVEKLAATNIAATTAVAAVAIGTAAVAASAVAKKAPTKAATPKSATKPGPTTTTTTTPKSAAAAKKPATPSATRSPAPAKPAAVKPPARTTPTTAPAAKPKTATATSRPSSAAAPKPATSTAAAKPKPTTAATKAAAPAPKPAVKTTIPPRAAAPTKPRVPAAQTNGDAKTEKKPEPVKKSPVTLTNRVPLSARPASAPTRTTASAAATKTASTVAAKTAAPKPASARPTAAKSPAAPAKPKATPASTVPAAKKPAAAAPKTNGVAARPAPAKRVTTKSAETKTEAKTVAKSCEAAVTNGGASPLANGVTVSE